MKNFRRFSNMSNDYAERMARFGMISKEDVIEIAKDPKSIFLDVRSDAELQAKTLNNYPFVHAPCTMTDTSQLANAAPKILPDKNGKFFSCVNFA